MTKQKTGDLLGPLKALPIETVHTAQEQASRALLAALILVREDPSANMLSSATWNDIKTAIARAEAAGIK
jgi:DNA-binding SARP family transcriptional activator